MATEGPMVSLWFLLVHLGIKCKSAMSLSFIGQEKLAGRDLWWEWERKTRKITLDGVQRQRIPSNLKTMLDEVICRMNSNDKIHSVISYGYIPK